MLIPTHAAGKGISQSRSLTSRSVRGNDSGARIGNAIFAPGVLELNICFSLLERSRSVPLLLVSVLRLLGTLARRSLGSPLGIYFSRGSIVLARPSIQGATSCSRESNVVLH